ncbi:hypothetical protein CCP3SC1_1530001 [Gammaproteobacteria bacterium]
MPGNSNHPPGKGYVQNRFSVNHPGLKPEACESKPEIDQP